MNKRKVLTSQTHYFDEFKNKYMVANDEGAICGGNVRVYIRYIDMNPKIDCPKVFATKSLADRFIEQYGKEYDSAIEG